MFITPEFNCSHRECDSVFSSYSTIRRRIRQDVSQTGACEASSHLPVLTSDVSQPEQDDSNSPNKKSESSEFESSESESSESNSSESNSSEFEPRPLSSSDDDDSEDDEGVDNAEFIHLLGQWKLNTNTSNSAMNLLLGVLRRRLNLRFLPKDSRTVIPPPHKIPMRPISGGHYHHFGLSSTISHVLREKLLVNGEILKLQLNIDGLPIHKSTDSSMWPILGLIEKTETKPFAIGIFYGQEKPQLVDEYLQEFITDYNSILLNGLLVGKINVRIEISAVICDTPARAFVKRTKAHNGYAACDKCTDPGEYHSNRMTFPDLNAALRTDDSFSQRTDKRHHKEGIASPFISANLGKHC